MRKISFLTLLFVSISWLHAQTALPFAGGPWVGNVTATSATSALRVKNEGVAITWLVSESAALTDAVRSARAVSQLGAGNVVKLHVSGLKADTVYHYGFEVAGAVREEPAWRGQFRTFPSGKASFKIAFSAGSDHRRPDQRAFDAMLAEEPALFIHLGDLHYADTNTRDPEDYRRNFDAVLNEPTQARFYRSMALAYMWDDHDFAGNDSDGTAIGRDAARQAYRDYVPHYPVGPNDGTIGQAFTIGRVRVIMTDLRSASSSTMAADDAAKTHLGAAQKAWFKQELIAARDAGHPLILWVCTMPWISSIGAGDDWSVYATERREIANFVKASGIRNLAILSGDMHGLAFDDGRNADYATGGGAPIVVLHGAALTSPGSVKGGPYSGGTAGGSLQYGVLEVTDNGGITVQCRYRGMRVGEGAKLNCDFKTTAGLPSAATGTAANAGERSLMALSSRDRISTVDGVTIIGFVVGGIHPRTMLIRAVGPSLVAHGVADALPDPKITVHKGPTVIAQNDNWVDGDAEQLNRVFARVGAGAFASSDGKDSALVITLAPGVYTAVVSSADGQVGTVLGEIFEVY